MPRSMSFALTTKQIRNRTKTVTRRLGWATLNPGDTIQAVEKAQGLRKGETVKRLCLIRVKSVLYEPLADITPEDVTREGFPGMTPDAFVRMFCETHRCSANELVRRIEFEYVE